MYSSKLYSLVKSFEQKEWKSLLKFSRSPFFNEREEITRLFERMYALSKKWEDKAWEKERMYSALFDGSYNDQKMRLFLSDAFALCETFLIHSQVEEKSTSAQISLARWYADKNHSKFFEQTMRELRGKQDKKKERDVAYYQQEFQIEDLAFYYHSRHASRGSHNNLPEVLQRLSEVFLSQFLQYHSIMTNEQAIVSTQAKEGMMPAVLEYLSNTPEARNIPLIGIYHAIFRMLSEKDSDNYFEEVFQRLEQEAHLFPEKERRALFSYARNYCIRRINQGAKQYQENLFLLFEQEMEKGLLWDDNGEVRAGDFKNIIVLALRLQKYAWTKSFIQQNEHRLGVEVRKDVVRYCLAKLAFEQKEWNEVIKLLSQSEYSDIFFNIDSRKLLLQTYYEQGEYELLSSNLNSFRVFIHRNKSLSEQFKEFYRNFANYLSTLVELYPHDQEKKKDLLQKVKDTTWIAERDWLMEKMG